MTTNRALNQEQREAVSWGKGPALVLAGPGSGKTFTITARIGRLIQEDGVPPHEILAITFTKAAALSMQSRFAAQYKGSVTFCTFHSLFYHILQQSGVPVRNLITHTEKQKLLFPLMKRKSENVSAEELGQLLEAFGYFKNTGNLQAAAKHLTQPWRQDFGALFEAYEQKRTALGKLDFDDMAYVCEMRLKADQEQLQLWQQRFSFILVDEFQDINPVQYRLLRLLAKPPYNIFAVGDDDQSIYGFRGSAPGLMKTFQKDYPTARLFSLNTNYRSTPEIVQASLAVIGLNTTRFSKQLKAAGPSGKDSVCLRKFEQKETQYRYITENLNSLTTAQAAQTAVLFRTNLQMQYLAAQLTGEGIPFVRKEAGTCIYDHFIAQDIMAYLRLGRGERNRSLFLFVKDKPKRSIPREAFREETVSLEQLITECRKKATATAMTATPMTATAMTATSMPATAMPAMSTTATAMTATAMTATSTTATSIASTPMEVGQQDEENVQKQFIILKALQDLETALKNLKSMKPYLAICYIRKAIGYDSYLKQKAGTDETKEREWRELLDFLTEDAKKHRNLTEWLEAQEAFRQKWKGQGTRQGERQEKKQEQGVHLLTVHAAKGLEFQKVYLPDVNEGIYPHGRLPGKEETEEECRLLYVAMTRAKESLELLTVTGTKENPRLPSRYLQNLTIPPP
jgi:superfamily I DNA/RNA helicase